MQISPYECGQFVRARGARWRVDDARTHASCIVVALSGSAGGPRRLIHPFDIIEPIPICTQPRIATVHRWRRACRQLIASDTPPGSLRQASEAQIDVMPHQLEPSMALLAGDGTRVLLADDVGLGKTIQAGLIVSELRARGWIDRVLVLTPAGLREQWRGELRDRFAIDASRVDAQAVRRIASELPLGVNPWSTMAVAIASTDYVKRAEVLGAVAACRWDVVIVDEAHNVEGDSDRSDAVRALTARASYVVLLTATPHSGDQRAFASLCTLGSIGDHDGDDRLLIFRRTRADVRLAARRRPHVLAVRPTAIERRMHAVLTRYSEAVRVERHDAWLPLSVLHKRAFSGAFALHESVARRLAALESSVAAADATQMALPLERDPGERTDADLAPNWPEDLRLADSRRERDLLTALAAAARSAAAGESKVSALRRLLRRAGESAIVFTEFRDTLLHLRGALGAFSPLILHGGLAREQREAVLDAFARSPRALLLATDAAGEGLNLHRTCRLVINLELPWNPMRLEQRAGRVDRIGQTRTVHAIHLVGAGTGELRVLDRLKRRIASARAEIGAPDPLGFYDGIDERHIARCVIEGDSDGPAQIARPELVEGRAGARGAEIEAARVQRARALATAVVPHRRGSPIDLASPLIAKMRPRLRARMPGCALLIWLIAQENASGAALESHLLPVTVPGVPRSGSHAEMKRIAMCVADRVVPHVDALCAEWRDASLRAIRSFATRRVIRERRILADVATVLRQEFQPGLFDRRADRAHDAHERAAGDVQRLLVDRLAHVERWSDARQTSPRLVLALLP